MPSSMIDISPLGLGLIALLMGFNGILSLYMHLEIGEKMFIAIVRSVLQLVAFGYMLVPIFNASHWAPVILFSMFMLVLSAREAYVRPQFNYKDLFWHVFASLTCSSFVLAIFGSALLVMINPFWEARYFIPILAMLLGNSISALTISLDTCLSHFKEGREQVEALLIRGASKWEASRGVINESVRSGLAPFFNQMTVICLAFLPGMMSGQILGGSPPDVAAHYQILMLVLIVSSSLLGATFAVLLAV